MMSELGKGLYKVTPADLSTQDFIPDCEEKGRGISSSTEAMLHIDLQQSLNGCPSRIRFNRDARCYTPAFVDAANEPSMHPNDQILREMFERKIVESTCHRAKIFQPKPSNDYCTICKESFQDYLKHITHPIHRKKIEASDCEADIFQLCKLAKKRASKSGESTEDAEMMGRKRRKMEESVNPQIQINNFEGKGNLFQQKKLLIVSTQ